jgi:hypothetical protein
MNLEQLKKNKGWRVQLEPPECHLNELGRQLPPSHDDWLIRDVSAEIVDIANTRTSHIYTLGKDHIHHFTTNPDRSRGDVRYGFLTLHVQLFVQGLRVWIRPNAKPGESVEP